MSKLLSTPYSEADKEVCPECRGDGFVRIRHTHPTESYYCFTENVQCDTCKGARYVQRN